MTRRTYGWVAGFIGAGIGTWLWRRMMAEMEPHPVALFNDRGTVIFANAPKPSETELAL